MKRTVVFNREESSVDVNDTNIVRASYGIAFNDRKYLLTRDYWLIEPSHHFKKKEGLPCVPGSTSETLESIKAEIPTASFYEFSGTLEAVEWALNV